MQEDLSVSIGDFGVATVMADVRTKTRTTVGKFNLMTLIGIKVVVIIPCGKTRKSGKSC